jgi:hypothetical protein
MFFFLIHGLFLTPIFGDYVFVFINDPTQDTTTLSWDSLCQFQSYLS